MSKATYNQAVKPSAATVSRAKSRRLEIRDMPERWITDARFAIRADLVPKLADRFDKLGICNEGNTTYPKLAPLVELAKKRGWLSVSIELDTIGRGSAHESWYRLVGKTVVDSVYATYFARILDGRKYGFAVSNMNPKTDPVLIIERRTETIVGMIMPAVGVNDGESSIEWLSVADAKPDPKPKQPKPFRLPKLPIRLDGRYITPEADDRLANNLQRRMAKELLRYAVSRKIDCPDCGSILDIRRAVYFAAESEGPNTVTCRKCLEKIVGQYAKTADDALERFERLADVVDGRAVC